MSALTFLIDNPLVLVAPAFAAALAMRIEETRRQVCRDRDRKRRCDECHAELTRLRMIQTGVVADDDAERPATPQEQEAA